ncbi:hypothetical protein M407DRAFT_11625 [Tulasnella calospora MUT 4182]|uniref:RNA-dependent RNA polymerase n=1 Tax=Tulasnella calospora MUT 4182 TaxID=1051891 RepID=A0A0C3Q5N4_9AGAM|nr:hypothetical protein M407DRAFT_11625 [Tulasnella calospora MUT 4182]
MSTPPQSEPDHERTKVKYPMEIFDGQPSPSSSAAEEQEPASQTLHERVSTSLDLHRLPGVHVDLDSDSDESMFEGSDARSWHSAESNVEHGDENVQVSPPPPLVEGNGATQIEDDDPYMEDTLDAAMSQLSMDDLARLQRSDRGEDSADDDDAMSISDLDDTSDANPDSSWVAVANTAGTTTDSNDDLKHKESIVLPNSPDVLPHNDLNNASFSGNNGPLSRRDIAPADCSIIAHSAEHTAWFDKYGVPWSAQWQVAVMVSNEKKEWEEITEQYIQALSGTNYRVGPKVLGVLFRNERQRAPSAPAQNRLGNPYFELDKEEAALDKGTFETLGLCSQSDDTTELSMGSWWGGRIEQRAVMVKGPKSICNGSKTSWNIQLFHQAMRGKSCRFTRKFGSRRFIQLGIPDLKDLTSEERNSLKEKLIKRHILNGRIFRAFFADGGTLISKWSARFKLGLSTSQPVLLFDTARIHFIDDIVPASQSHREGSPAAKHVMNDGCGLINRTALRLIQRQQDLPSMPTAVQGRIAGAKGLWILHPDDQENRPQIWLTKSQVKIQYTTDELDEDPSRRILDLLRVAQVKEPIRLSAQPVINLAHNGVPNSVFSELLQESLKSTIDHVLESWDSDDGVAMWSMVFDKSGIGNIRKRRYEKFSERVFGSFRDTEEEEDNFWTSDGLAPSGDISPFNGGPDPNSGCPTDSAEQIIELLQAGFIPSKCRHLAKLMERYLEAEVRRITRGYHILVNRSAEVFAAPDFSRTLKPGEVFFRSSRRCALIDDDDMTDGIVHGNMVIFRYPIKTPSDARLVKAVDYPQLREFRDVLLFSVLGDRSEASILAGGDYDGDTICMITEPRLVNAFKNSSLRFADPPDGFDEHLETAVCRSQEILSTMSFLSEADSIRELQNVLLDAVTRENYCGMYSNWSDIATFMYGYGSDRTHYLSYMVLARHFNELDAGKSGIHVKSEVWERDREEFGRLNQPACMKKSKSGRQKRVKEQPEEDDPFRSEENDPPRSENLGPFVLKVLNPFAEDQEKRYIQLIKKLNIGADADCDPALLAPLHDADRRANLLREEGQDGMWREMESLKSFVKINRESWAELFRKKRPMHTPNASSRLGRTSSQHSPFSGPSEFYSLPKAVQIQEKREVSDEFWNGFKSPLKHFSEDEARRVMCSYAYHHAQEKAQTARDCGGEGSFGYVFAVAFKTLTEMKSKASGGLSSSCIEPFHDLMIPRRGIRSQERM